MFVKERLPEDVVAPLAGARIEIYMAWQPLSGKNVAPLAGARIEIVWI